MYCQLRRPQQEESLVIRTHDCVFAYEEALAEMKLKELGKGKRFLATGEACKAMF